jgi:sarcosine oxidase
VVRPSVSRRRWPGVSGGLALEARLPHEGHESRAAIGNSYSDMTRSGSARATVSRGYGHSGKKTRARREPGRTGRGPSPARCGRPPGYAGAVGADRVDVVIIGAGLAGSATAWALSRRGRSAVVLEAFQPGHRHGSSHGSARIFRRSDPDPLYVRLAGEAHRLWRQLADEAGEELVLTTGGIDFGPAREQEKMYEILRAFGVPAELLPPAAAAERWPGVAFGSDPVMFHPDAGVIDAEHAMSAMRALAEAHGAQIHYGSPVLSVSASEAGAVVRTADRSWHAPAVVVAAGAWLEPLLGAQVALPPLVVTQQQAFHFAPQAPAGPRPVLLYRGEVAMYGLLAGRDGEVPGAVKVGAGARGAITTGDDRDGIVDPAGREEVRAFVRETLEDLDPDPVGELTCLYTSTATEDFILDRRGPFVICSACSGHGAKFAPLTGELAADLACGGPAADPRFTLAAHGA